MLPAVTSEAWSIDAVRHALGDARAESVAVVERFPASCAEVARLRVAFSGGREPWTVIGKSARGAGLAAARRERRFFEQLAPLWAHPAPALLGACEQGSGEDARLLLLTEDLAAAGYRLLPQGASIAQLEAVIDLLVSFHARFWGEPTRGLLDQAGAAPSVTQSTQAWPPAAISAHAIAAREAAASFLSAESDQLTAGARDLLEQALDVWERQFLARAGAGCAITLIHGDFHLLGNIFFADDARPPRVIDWSELKPGLGPHDLAYCLLAAPAQDRPARDLALLRRYWERLRAAGVELYSWDLCRWDHQFSLITNLFQSVLQHSVPWFLRTAAVVDELDGRAALGAPPPVI